MLRGGSGRGRAVAGLRGHLRRQRIRPEQKQLPGAYAVAQAQDMTGILAPATLEDELSMQLLHQRIIVLGAEVDDPLANRVTAQLLLLSARDSRADISLYINSPGGSVTAGLAIYDTMRVIPNDVSTLAVGFAASMGQFLLGAGTPGKRFALPNARIMMHQPSAGIQGTAADVEVQAANLKAVKRRVNELQAEHTGQSVELITRDSERDRWFSATEAVAYGIVDHVVTALSDVRPAGVERRVGLR